MKFWFPFFNSDAGRSRLGAMLTVSLVVGLAPWGYAQGVCGNGLLEGAESCDDGNLSSTDCCSATCQLIACSPTPPIGAEWEDLGPMNLGGRVTALAVDPQDSNRVIIGTPSAGIWESRNGGLTWNGLAPYLGLIRLSTASIDPSNSDRFIFGTGEITDGGTQRKGVGLIQTEDSGASYQMNPPPSNPYMAQVMIWEQEPTRVLVATDLGIWISHDGGSTLTESLRGQSISALQRDPFDSEGVYAAGRSGLFRSDDRGETFVALASWPLGPEASGPGVGMATLAVSGQVEGRLYTSAQVLAAFDKTDEVLLLFSDDGGQTLQLLATAPPFCPTSDSCGYAHALAIDPENDSRLLAGGDLLYASEDGGSTWSAVAGSIHGIHEIALFPGGGFVASKSGVARLNADWTDLETRNTGLAITGVESLDVSNHADERILIGTAHAGTILSAPGGADFEQVFGDGAPAGPVAFDPLDSNAFIVSRPDGTLFHTSDLGASFSEITNGIDTTQPALDVPPLVANPLVYGGFYIGRMQVYSTTDSGDSWQAFRPAGFPEIANLWPSPVDLDRLYFGLKTGGKLYRADDTHTYIMDILPDDPNLVLNSIFLDPDAENVLYAALTDGKTQKGLIFKSYNFGQDWTDISPRDLPPAHAVVRDRFGAVYVGTAKGMVRSANDGFTWAPFQYGLSAFGIRFLELENDQLYAGTTGRGLFRTPIQELISIDTIPPGLPLLIDGSLVSSPVFAQWDVGTLHTVEPYLIQTADTRQRFDSWSDTGDVSHVYTTPSANDWLSVAIIESYRLQTSVRGNVGGELLTLPLSPDGFYDSGSFVSVIAIPEPTYRLASLNGNLNGVQDGLGLVLMDRPRSVEAIFEPLELELLSEPSGLELSMDGSTVTTPAAFTLEALSQHLISAPERISLSPGDPVELVFDSWSDLRNRSHVFTMYRDSFLTDLVASYLRTTPEVTLGGGLGHRLRSPGQADAPRSTSLELRGELASPAVSGLVFLRGEFQGTLNIEVPLVPSLPATQHHRFIRGGGLDGKTRLVIHNPAPTEASVSLLLRAPDGTGLVARAAAVLVPGLGRSEATLRELIALPPLYEGLLTVISAQPVSVSLQTVTENLRSTTMLDPILYVPFGSDDPGVPNQPFLQVLICSADTAHELVLINTGNATLSGTVSLADDDGAALLGIPDTGGSTTSAYLLPPGGHQSILIDVPFTPPAEGSICSAQVKIEPDTNQDSPWVQLIEKQQVGETANIPIVLPRTMPPSASHERIVIPVDQLARDSGIVVTNLAGSAQTLDLALRNEIHVLQDTASVLIPAWSQRVLLTSEIFPGSPADFRGTFEATSNGEMSAAGINVSTNDRGEQLVSGFPVFSRSPLPIPIGAPVVRFPHFVDGDTWSSELFLFNPSATESDFSLIFRDSEGAETPFPIEAP